MPNFHKTTIDHIVATAAELSATTNLKRWTTLTDIVKTLNALASKKQMVHSFLPRGGGLDLSGSKPSSEANCIELNLSGQTHIGLPESLYPSGIASPSTGSRARIAARHWHAHGNAQEQGGVG